jgi:hypothetical protein
MSYQQGPSGTNPEQDLIEVELELILPCVAEETIVKTILEGSIGLNNHDLTEPGLRFVRHLLSTSRSARSGFVPNFKDIETVRHLARQFIRRCGGAALALQALIRIAHFEQA